MTGRPRVRTAPTRVLLALTGAQAAVERALSRPSEINPSAVRYLTQHGHVLDREGEAAARLSSRMSTLEEGMRRSEAWLREQGLLAGGIT